MENFYEKMHLDMTEATYFEPPHGEEQERVDAAEAGDEDNTEKFDRVEWLAKQDRLLGEGWDD